jgi:hypothetical protein
MANKLFTPCRHEVAKKSRKLRKAQGSIILQILSYLDGFENVPMEPDAYQFKLCLVPNKSVFLALDNSNWPGLTKFAIGVKC